MPNLVLFTTFNKFYQLLCLYKYASKFNVTVDYNGFTFTAMRKAKQDFTTIKVERGYDSVGGTVKNAHPTVNEIFEIECDLFLAFAKEWHTANPVREREQITEQYQQERRYALNNL